MADTRPLPGGHESLQTIVTPGVEKLPSVESTASLVLIYPSSPFLGRRYILEKATTTIGRATTCTIVNPDDSVSRHHARLDYDAHGRYTVTDLGSTNGTFINDIRATGRTLRDGDYLRVGNSIYRFLASGNVEAQYHEEIYRLTVLDPLTGIHNRRYCLEVLHREIARSVRHHRPLALALFDIDRFKSINDEFGHVAGDRVLREVATRVKALVRTEEVFARYGGEEFIVILSESDKAHGQVFGERVRAAIEAEPFYFHAKPHAVTVSVGVSTIDGHSSCTPDELIQAADELMYASKKAGRNRVTV